MKTKLLLMLVVAAVLSISAGAEEITIVNPGFEAVNLSDGEWPWMMDNEGWGCFSNNGELGPWNPENDYYGGDAPEGKNVGWTWPGDGVDGGFAQVLTATFDPNSTYTLTVEVGNNWYYAWGGYKVQLLAGGIPQETGDGSDYTGVVSGGVLLAEDDSSVFPAEDTFATATVVYKYDPADAALVGFPLQIRLLAKPGTEEIDFDDVRLTVDAMNPSPYDGETVYGGDVELSWTNMDPNIPAPVYVDVWFGDDPNVFGSPAGTKVLDKEPDATSVIVEAPVVVEPTSYYWQIVSYIDGGGPQDKGIEGPVYTFYAVNDLPIESVDAGSDMVTWDGRAVELDASVVDDEKSTLSYLWSANPAAVVEFSATDVEDPAVTITKVAAPGSIQILNSGFERPVSLDDGDWARGLIPDWTLGRYTPSGSNVWLDYYTTEAGVVNPDAATYGYEAPEGENTGWVNTYNTAANLGMRQVLAASLQADTTYTLSVDVGNPAFGGSPSDDLTGEPYRIDLLAGGEFLATKNGTTPDANSTTGIWINNSLTYDSAGNPELVGEALEIRLVARYKKGLHEIDFDNVRLTADPPHPSSEMIYTLTVVVSDENVFNAAPVEDAMRVYVYNDACKAAIGAGLSAVNPSDIDGDCITEIEDFAELASAWLVDNTLTEAVAK